MSAPFNIVLVEPRIPQNTGNIARTCAATGCALHLVGPMAFEIDDAKLRRAGLDYWKLLDITQYTDWQDFILKHSDKSLYYFSTKAARLYTDASFEEGCFLVFGREDAGLPEQLLRENYSRCVRLPMLDNPAARSLNLSNTVAVAVYEAFRQNDFTSLKPFGTLPQE